VLTVLFQRKAKLDVKNAEGQTALMLACRNGWIPMIELLVSEGEHIYYCMSILPSTLY